MPATGSVTISGQVTGLVSGSKSITPTAIASAAAIGTIQTVSISAVFTAVTVPTGATCVIIQPPSTNTQTVILKQVTGDASGISLHKTFPTMLSLFGTTTTFGFISSGACDLELTWV